MWVYDSILERTIDVAGKFYVKILTVDTITGEERAAFLKFQTDPTDAEVQVEGEHYCQVLNDAGG